MKITMTFDYQRVKDYIDALEVAKKEHIKATGCTKDGECDCTSEINSLLFYFKKAIDEGEVKFDATQ